MNRTIRNILAAAVVAVPFVATAQTTVPADQPRTNLEKQQTEQQGAATKYGEQGSSAGSGQTNRKDATQGSSMSKDAKSSMSTATNKTTKPNDDTSTPTPTNTVSPTTTK